MRACPDPLQKTGNMKKILVTWGLAPLSPANVRTQATTVCKPPHVLIDANHYPVRPSANAESSNNHPLKPSANAESANNHPLKPSANAESANNYPLKPSANAESANNYLLRPSANAEDIIILTTLKQQIYGYNRYQDFSEARKTAQQRVYDLLHRGAEFYRGGRRGCRRSGL